MILFGLPMTLGAASRALTVRYRSADTVYIDGGRDDGVAVGDRLEVLAGNEIVAELEVLYVADHSASCRILETRGEIEPGARVRQQGAEPVTPPAGASAVASASPPAAEVAAPSPVVLATRPTYGGGGGGRLETQVSGSLTFDWESFQDASDLGLDFTRTTTRLRLRVRDIGGGPFSLRIRGSSRRLDRSRSLASGAVPSSETRDRFYELAFAWEPPEGRFALRAGRLAVTPGIGIGYLDGVMGEVAVTPGFDVGAFYGAGVDVEDLSFDSNRQKYGLFTRFTSHQAGRTGPFEVMLAGIREEGETAVSREYVALQTRYDHGGRWAVYQWAEVDLNRGWRKDLSGSSAQLSNFSLTARIHLGESSLLSLSYDRYERYRTEETRFLEDALFDDLTRQGLRFNLRLGHPGRLGFSVLGGVRERNDEQDAAYHLGIGVSHPRLIGRTVSLSGTLIGFSNDFTEGGILRLELAKRLGGGHRVSLTLGGRFSQSQGPLETQDRTTGWARLGGWFELPGRLFVRVELEVTRGDDLEGERFNLGLGYRF